jgi:hypothetical protein
LPSAETCLTGRQAASASVTPEMAFMAFRKKDLRIHL